LSKKIKGKRKRNKKKEDGRIRYKNSDIKQTYKKKIEEREKEKEGLKERKDERITRHAGAKEQF
jgi:hypothetical protein